MSTYNRQIGNRQSAIENPVIVWSILAVTAVMVCGLVVAAPVALTGNHETIAVTIYAGFSKVCHQLSERSFYLAGHPLAVCSRCTGLYAGFTALLLFYPLARSLKSTDAPPRKWFFWATAPMAIDVGVRLLGIWDNTHSSRFFTGALLGAVSVFYVMPGVIDLSLRFQRRASISGNLPLTTTTGSTATVAAAPSDYSAPERRI
jgi:uncharacterized membrane protein